MDRLAGKVVILMYHRVIPASEARATFVQPGMYVTPESFERHLRHLRERFTILGLQQLLDRWHDGRWEPHARYCVITFDDGWRDNYRYAYPLLRAFGAPATIFLPVDYVGSSEWLWWDALAYLLGASGGTPEERDSTIEELKSLAPQDRDRAIQRVAIACAVPLPRSRRFIDWTEAHEMSRHGITFGSHTCTHAILPRLDGAALERELRHPLEVLSDRRIAHVPALSYPNGDYDAAVASAAASAGYRAAVTTKAGAEGHNPSDLFALPRVGVHDDVARSAAALRFHIARQLWTA